MSERDNPSSIRHPEAWHLLVQLQAGSVAYALYTPAVHGSLITGTVTPQQADTALQALQNAIIDTPLLLDDYGRVSVLVQAGHTVLLPPEATLHQAQTLLHAAYPDQTGDAALCPMPNCGVTVASLMPAGLSAFVHRTFNNPTIYHHLMPLCEHFVQQGSGSRTSRMLLNLHGSDQMDIIVCRQGQLADACSYRYTNPNDAAYLALNAWRVHQMDQLTDELQLTGDRQARATMTPLLRRYVKYVMPAIYPAAAMRLGSNAMQAPLELILLALNLEQAQPSATAGTTPTHQPD